MKRIAIIGTRNPTLEQIKFIENFLISIDSTSAEIISGCCDGVDEIAIKKAKDLGFKTIGVVPWRKYNLQTQTYCTEIISDKVLDEKTKQEATESVYKYHPAPKACSPGAILLHSRNYIIVYKADLVVALPKNMSGGTMQGVRISTDLGIRTMVIDEDGIVVKNTI